MAKTKTLTLVLGGARSGKSSFAVDLVKQSGGSALFVATAVAGDEEMARRIRLHRESRPREWATLEVPTNLGAALREHGVLADIILIDCIGVLVSNLLLEVAGEDPERWQEHFETVEKRVLGEVRELLQCFEALTASFVIVSNEVGLGLVPPYPSGRAYRDLLGSANQLLARAADQVHLLVAGIPMPLKVSGSLDRLK